MSPPGHVALIGGGPGPPDLLTVRAARIIGRADVVFWGRRFATEDLVREHARPGADLLPWPPTTMADLYAAYDRAAVEGLLIARLFSGDTAVFSRLGEEIAAVEERGLSWEVVPGITAASAAAAAAGRELTAGADWPPVTFTSPAHLDAVASGGAALALYMAGRDGLTPGSVLLDAGRPAVTPCAVVRSVGWADGSVVHCRLDELDDALATRDGGLLTVVLVGAPTRHQ